MKKWVVKLLGRTPSGGMDCHEVGALLQQSSTGTSTPTVLVASRRTSRG